MIKIGIKKTQNNIRYTVLLMECPDLLFPNLTFLNCDKIILDKYEDKFFEYIINGEKTKKSLHFSIRDEENNRISSISILRNYTGPIRFEKDDDEECRRFFYIIVKGTKLIKEKNCYKQILNRLVRVDIGSLTLEDFKKIKIKITSSIEKIKKEKEFVKLILNNYKSKMRPEIYIIGKLMIEKGIL